MVKLFKKVISLLFSKEVLPPAMSEAEQQLSLLLLQQEQALAKKIQLHLESKCLDQMVQTASSMRDAGLTQKALHKLEHDTLQKHERANALISRLLNEDDVEKSELEEFGVK